MGRGAELEGADHVAEVRIHFGAGIAADFEGAVHGFRIVIANGAAGELGAVTHDVVLPGEDIKRVLCIEGVETALGHGEGVVGKDDLAAVFFAFVHGEISDPAEGEEVGIAEVQAFGEDEAEGAEGGAGSFPRGNGEEEGVAVLDGGGGADGVEFGGREELDEGAFGAVGVEGDVGEAFEPLGKGPVLEAIEEGARGGGAAGIAQGFDGHAGGKALSKDAAGGVGERFTQIA